LTDDLSKKALEVSKITQFKLGNDESYEFVTPVFSSTSKIGIVRLGIKVNIILQKEICFCSTPPRNTTREENPTRSKTLFLTA
jgi:hypothetical protein